MRRRRRGSQALVLVLASLLVGARDSRPSEPGAREELPGSSAIGMNLSRLRYWEPAAPFVDLFRASGTLQSNEGPFPRRPDGYPRSLAAGQRAYCVLLSGLEGRQPAGRYECRWQGKGALRFGQDATLVESEEHRAVLEVTPHEGLYVEIRATDPDDPIRAIELRPAVVDSAPDTTLFDPGFLATLRPFAVIRTMNWLGTNDSALVHAEDRVRPDSQTQGGDAGVAWEYVAELCNALRAACWLNVPHGADDDCVRAMAECFHATLTPGLPLYVEYSNETWNGMFEQARECRRRGLERGLSRDEREAGLRYSARRSVEVFRIFDEVLQGRRPRVRVIATQAANPWTARTELAAVTARSVDALAVAAYFGGSFGAPENAERTKGLTAEEILDECIAEIDGPLRALLAENRAIAAEHGLPLLSYEGGAHLVGVGHVTEDAALTARLHEVSRHPRMEEVYDRFLARWREVGQGPLLAYSHLTRYDKYGSFGHLEHQDQDPRTAPKYHALLRAIEERRGGR